MDEEFILIPEYQINKITVPFFNPHVLAVPDSIYSQYYVPASYKYFIREDMFVDDVVMFEIIFYIGTRYSPRKTSGSKFASLVLSLQFTTQVKDKSILDNKMWDYVYSLEGLDAKQLKGINYKTYINPDVMADTEADVKKMFKTLRYIQW